MRTLLTRTLDKFVFTVAIATILGSCANTSTQQSGVQRMYVFNCGESTVSDVSRWTPGANVGKSFRTSALIATSRMLRTPVE